MERYKPPSISTKIVFRNQNFDAEKFALDEGRENRPSHDETTLDEGQSNLSNHFREEYIKQTEAISKYIEEIKEKEKTGINVGIDLSYEGFINNLRVELATENAREEHKLKSLAENKSEFERNLNHFKRTNKINRAPNYPLSKIFHYSIIIVIILIESFANAYFFAQGNDLGLLGGWLQACLISLANVGSAILIGAGVFPFINHISVIKKILSTFGLIVFSTVSISFNLAAAHYRDLLEKSLNPLTHSIESILQDPFGISFHGFMLFIVGIVAAILAFIKGYTSDDPYPGYGNVDRRFKHAKGEYEEFESKEINKIQDIVKELIGQYEIKLKEGKKEIIDLKDSVSKGNDALQIFANKAEAINEKLNEFLKRYREANSSVRTDPPPEYFSEYPHYFAVSTDGFTEFTNIIDNKIMDLKEGTEILESKNNSFKQEVLDILADEIKNLETRFRKLYGAAKKNVSSRETNNE